MKKVVKAMLATAAAVSISAGVSLPSAFADDTDVVSRSAKGLSSYQVFQSAGTTFTDGQTLATKLRGSDFGVVVIPEKDVESKSARQIASEIRSSAGVEYSTVIVVLDGQLDSLGVSSSNREVEDRVSSYLGNGPVKDSGWTLSQNSEKLINVEKDLKAEADKVLWEAEKAAKTAEHVEAIKTFAPFLAIALFPFLTIFFIRRYRKRTRNKDNPVKYGFRKMPKSLREAVNRFRKVADLHKNLERNSLYDSCNNLIARFIDLEEKMEKLKGNDSQMMILEVEYVERLDKLSEAIGENYYLNILEDPSHWEDPTKKIKRVKDAVGALSTQVLESIRQINDSSNLEFKIALDSIIGDKNVKVEDLYK